MDSLSLDAADALSAKGATHPRVSLDDMREKIVAEHYLNAGEAISMAGQPLQGDSPLKLMTLCFLVMKNGWVVLGKSAPVSPENFDAEKCRTFAYEDAIRQLWPLEGYALREKLHGQA